MMAHLYNIIFLFGFGLGGFATSGPWRRPVGFFAAGAPKPRPLRGRISTKTRNIPQYYTISTRASSHFGLLSVRDQWAEGRDFSAD